MTAQIKSYQDSIGDPLVRELAEQLNDSRGHANFGPVSCTNGATTIIPLMFAQEDCYLYDLKLTTPTVGGLAAATTDLFLYDIADYDMSASTGTVIKSVEEMDANNLAANALLSFASETELTTPAAVGTTWAGSVPARVAKNHYVVLAVVNDEAGAVDITGELTYTPIKDEIEIIGGGISASAAKVLRTRDR